MYFILGIHINSSHLISRYLISSHVLFPSHLMSYSHPTSPLTSHSTQSPSLRHPNSISTQYSPQISIIIYSKQILSSKKVFTTFENILFSFHIPLSGNRIPFHSPFLSLNHSSLSISHICIATTSLNTPNTS